MPELPDVETFRRYFERHALNQPVARTSIPEPSLLQDCSSAKLQRALKDHSFKTTARRGKYLFAHFDTDRWLVLHFGMTGHLRYQDEAEGQPDYACLILHFDNDALLAYIAQRKLGQISLTDDPDSFAREHELGPDALALSREAFLEATGDSRRQAKSWLMDQATLSGIGNVYSDEILFQAGIHPRRHLDELDEADRRALFDTMHEVLEAAIEAQADPERMPEDWLLPHREDGAHCPRCGGPVEKVSAAGRTAWFCPHCQPAPEA